MPELPLLQSSKDAPYLINHTAPSPPPLPRPPSTKYKEELSR